jgi:hypothetical protein
MEPERRKVRSEFAGEALHLWLRAVNGKQGLRALVLADDSGMLVASSFVGPEAEELAALAPIFDPTGASPTPPTDLSLLPMIVHPIQIDDTAMFLCAVGDEDCCEEGARAAETGVRRILGD